MISEHRFFLAMLLGGLLSIVVSIIGSILGVPTFIVVVSGIVVGAASGWLIAVLGRYK